MRIEANVKVLSFGEVEEGDVFRCGNSYYLKIPPCTSEAGYDYNCFDLEVNAYSYFSNEREVTLVNAKLVIG